MAEEAEASQPTTPMQVMMANFNRLTIRQKMAGAAALAFAIALLVGVWLWSRQPDYSVLFSNIDSQDGGAIITVLQQQNVPYRVENGGTAILVPSQQANELRLTLAAQGLPRGGSVGFELFEKEKLGLSQFHEQIDYQRALEGELARTIQSIRAIAGARVHLAIPKQTAFLRDEQKPTASVVVSLRQGRKLDASQVAGIVHLVASSVPDLSADQVSVIDQNGDLISRRPEDSVADLDDTQLEYVKNVENSYIERIRRILTPMLGVNNFRAQVMASIDFDNAEQTSETYKPNPAPNTAIRSQQTTESMTTTPGPTGVPGALSNQPPVPATAPITTPAVPGQATASNVPTNTNKSATTNYELDKTVQHIKRAVGQVRRISVALVVNHRTEKDPKGNVKTVPLTADEVTKITAVVREAVGYDETRGDTINVTNTAFAESTPDVAPALPWYKDPEIVAMIKEAARWLALALGILIVYKKVIKPLLKSVAPPEPEKPEEEEQEEKEEGMEPSTFDGEGEASGEESDIPPEVLALELAKMSYEKKLARARELAEKDPKAVAQLIKDWIAGGSGGEGH